MKNKRGNSRSEFLFNNNLLNSKRSQVTVFVILAIAIVVVLVLLFLGKDVFTTLLGGKSPVEQIKDCAEDYAKEAVEILSVQGGSVEPEHYYLYEGNKVEYLCYTEENYEKCVMQKPLLKQSVEKEIEDYVSPKVKGCMASVKADLEKDGYSVGLGDVEVYVELIPGNILVNIDSDFVISKEKIESYKSIKTDVPSKLYDLVMIASSILNWEARYGDSESMTYMLYYPSLKVEPKKQGEGTTIYILTNRVSLDKFIFASRSVVLPAGLTGN